MNLLSNALVLVLGLGESGLAMARWCARQGARVRLADTRPNPPGLAVVAQEIPEAERVLGPFGSALLDGVDFIALSPGIAPSVDVVQQAHACAIPVLGEMALFALALDDLGARANTRIIAITGTNGKTTVTALTAALCVAAGMDAVAAGNISPAALTVLMDRLDAGRQLPECWVLELSSFQLETGGGFRADASVVLNVSDDHLDRHGDIARYAEIKSRIYNGEGVQVINRDDPLVVAMIQPGRSVVGFSANPPMSTKDFGIVPSAEGDCLVCGDACLLPVSQMKLAGRHNHANALAALALGEVIGCSRAQMVAGLRSFRGLPHRVELVAARGDGVRFFDDSKGTNVGATLAAISGLGCRVVLIAGGDGKGQDFSPLRSALEVHGRAVVLLGRDADRVADALDGLDIPVLRTKDMAEAVGRAADLAQCGDAVLLSPACSSLDMFRNYVHRAEVFVAAVNALPEVMPA